MCSSDLVQAMFGVATSNVSNDAYREVEGEWGPRLATFYQQLFLQPELVARYRSVYENRESMDLNPEQLRLVERDYEQLVRAGALIIAEIERIDRMREKGAGDE